MNRRKVVTDNKIGATTLTLLARQDAYCRIHKLISARTALTGLFFLEAVANTRYTLRAELLAMVAGIGQQGGAFTLSPTGEPPTTTRRHRRHSCKRERPSPLLLRCRPSDARPVAVSSVARSHSGAGCCAGCCCSSLRASQRWRRHRPRPRPCHAAASPPPRAAGRGSAPRLTQRRACSPP